MVLFKRKKVQPLSNPVVSDDTEVWTIEETGEFFVTYEDYLRRNDFYRQKRFICEITGHSNLTFREGLRSELEASGAVEDAFPEPLREHILRKVQFSQVARIDYLVDWIYEEFKNDFYPGERVQIVLEEERFTAVITEKVRFPELLRDDKSVERKGFARYCVIVDQRPGVEAVLDEQSVSRERKAFTKNCLRSYLKNSITRESWTGAPWLVKSRLAENYRITTDVPLHLTQEYQVKLKKLQAANNKKTGLDSASAKIHAFGGPGAPGFQLIRPKGSKKPTAHDEQLCLEYTQYLQMHPPTTDGGFPAPPPGYQVIIAGSDEKNELHSSGVKGQTKPVPPPQPKYPIEDLEIPPTKGAVSRPAFQFLSIDTPLAGGPKSFDRNVITMDCVGPLLETWNTLNVYCDIFYLDSFTFDDYVEALRVTSSDLETELLSEIHCGVLKRLVNDSNDKNGQVQITLPNQPREENDNMVHGDSHQHTPEAESEIGKPPARSTRSSLVKSDAAELREAAHGLSLNDARPHAAMEMGRAEADYDWKTRLQKRDLHEGRWACVVVGLLLQLSHDPRMTEKCDDILAQLAPLDCEPSWETAYARYLDLDLGRRVTIIQILCMKSLETAAIKGYIEDCSTQMTQYRKERNDQKRNLRTAIEDLRILQEERKALEPQNTASSVGHSEIPEMEEPNSDAEEEMLDDMPQSEGIADSEEDAPHQGRSLRRANDRATARRKKAGEDRDRKAAAAIEKAKKPSKEEKKLEKLLNKIEAARDTIKEYEEQILTTDNDLREADCPRTRVLGKDRFWNRYYWMERNAMPYAGLPDSSTAHAGYANGCIWVQGPDDLERTGFIELSAEENAQYDRAFQMTVPQRKFEEEGSTHVFTAQQWGYYDNPDSLDLLIGWLDARGLRESRLKKELQTQRNIIAEHMIKRKEYLMTSIEKADSIEGTTRTSARTRTTAPRINYRCLNWHNTTAMKEQGHLHSEAKPMTTRKQRGVAMKKTYFYETEEEAPARQMRGGNRQASAGGRAASSTNGRVPGRQESRYNF